MAKASPWVFDPFNRAYHIIGEKVADAWKVGAPHEIVCEATHTLGILSSALLLLGLVLQGGPV